MAQHPRPIGPAAQNNAATVSIEMFQGCRPAPKWNGYSTRTKGGHQVSQTTHVVAPFAPNMIEATRPQAGRPFSTRTHLGTWAGMRETLITVSPTPIETTIGCLGIKPRLPVNSRGPFFFPFSGTTSSTIEAADAWAPDSPRVRPPQRNGWIAQTTQIDPFDIAALFAYRPHSPRLFLAPKIPLPVSQTTHVPTVFSVDMAEGWAPDRHRYSAPFHQGAQLWTAEVYPFSMEMVYGWKPESPRLEASGKAATRGGWQVSQTTHVQAPITADSIFIYAGVPRLEANGKQPARGGWHVSQPTHVNAAFTPDMVEGWWPDRNRYGAPFHQGQSAYTPEVLDFSIDMIMASRPERPRLFLAPRIPLPVSQTTHVSAPFTYDMVDGWLPERHRYSAPFHQGTVAQTPEIPVFSIEMVVGYKPDRPRLEASGKFPLRNGWSVSQPTHVSAPFTYDMVDGWMPERHRYTSPLHTGSAWWPPDVDPFSIEMVKGWRPDSPRLFLAPRIPLPVSQTTQVNAPLTNDMAGWQPERHRYRAPFHQGVSIMDYVTTITVLSPISPDRAVTVPAYVRLVIVPEDIRSV